MDTTRRNFLAGVAGLAGVRGIDLGTQEDALEGRAEVGGEEPVFHMVPVGAVEKDEHGVRIRILDRYADGLLGLEAWSHVNVFYWFDRNDVPQRRSVLRVHPRGDKRNPLTGVFACRAPVRPNLLALSVCRILSIEGRLVTIDEIDAFDGTPVVDLKPVIPPDVSIEDLRVPEWTGGDR